MISLTWPNNHLNTRWVCIGILFFFCHAVNLLAEPMNLVDLQKLALKNNPRIKAMEGEVRMAQARILQSQSFEDLKLKFAINSLPLDTLSFRDEDMTSKEIGISQMVPLWGKRAINERIAEIGHLKSFEALRKERIEILNRLRIGVYEMAAARQSKEILSQTQSQLRLLINSETALSKTGMGTLSGVIGANIESIMIDEKQVSLDQKIEALRSQIIYLAGTEVEIKTNFPEPSFKEISAEMVTAALLKENPEIKMVSYGILESREEMRLREKAFYPDMEAGISYMQRDDTSSAKRADMVSAMLSFNIPMWVKGKKAGVEEMKSKNESREEALKETMNQLKQQTKTLMADMEKWRKIHALYTERVVPQADLEFQSALAGYRTSGGLVTVIERLKSLLAFQNERVNAETAYLISRSELSSLIGTEVLQ